METLLIGNLADFQTPKSGQTPRWEHNVLAEAGARFLAIDRLCQRGRFRSFKGIDPSQLRQIAKAGRGATRCYAQSEQSGTIAAIAFRIFRVKTPLGIIFHGQRWWTRRNRFLITLAGKLSNVRFLCLSSALQVILVKECGISPAKVIVTGYGVDSEFFQGSNQDPEQLIVSAGAASRDYQTLVEAVQGLPIDTIVAADSTWYPEPLNIKDGTPKGRTTFASATNYLGLRRLYERAQIVVVPLIEGRYAAGYAVIAEGMSMGKPVIATRTSAPSDLITDGENGILVPPGNIDALRSAITSLMASPERAAALGVAARRSIEEQFNIAAYTQRLDAAVPHRVP